MSTKTSGNNFFEINGKRNVEMGTSEHDLVEIPIFIIFKRSKRFEEWFRIFKKYKDFRPNVFTSVNFKNMELYKRFITRQQYNFNELANLFEICYYLKDKDAYLLSERIVFFVSVCNMDIKEAFRYLQLIYYTEYRNQFIKLLYAIYIKYDNGVFLNELSYLPPPVITDICGRISEYYVTNKIV